MAIRKVWIGSVGPFLYDDEAVYKGEASTLQGIRTEDGIIVGTGPDMSLDPTGFDEGLNYVPRVADINVRMFAISVADIDNPAAELIAYSGDIVGSFIIAHEVLSNWDEYTIYAWDTDCGSGANVPYVVSGASSGFWIAIGGKYNNMPMSLFGDISLLGNLSLITGKKITVETIDAVDGDGLSLKDDAGNYGLQVLDLGQVKISNVFTLPTADGTNLQVLATNGAGVVGWQDPDTTGLHASSHEDLGADEINVGGLSGLLGDGQTPLAHKTSHQNGGSDEINVDGLSGKLADEQTPLGHDLDGHEVVGGDQTKYIKVNDGTPVLEWITPANLLLDIGAAATAHTHTHTHTHASTTGRTANDHHSEIHAASHQNGGGDEISVAGLSGVLADAQTPSIHAHAHADTTGKTVNDHHNQSHAIDGGDHSGTLSHTTLSNIGTNTHTQVDTHLANTANPHNVIAGDMTGTLSRAAIFNGSGVLAAHGTVDDTELGYLDGVTSSIQTQLDGKSASSHSHTHASTTGRTVNDHHNQSHAIGGGDHSGTLSHTALSDKGTNTHTQIDTHIADSANPHSVVTGDMTGTLSRVAVFNGSGILSADGSIDTTELGYLNGVSSSIQTQLDGKALSANGVTNGDGHDHSGGDGGNIPIGSITATLSRALEVNGSGFCVASAVSSTELNYLNGLSSSIQTQLDGKALSSHGHASTDITSTALRAAVFDSSGDLIASAVVSATEIGYLNTVSSNIQTQIDGKADDENGISFSQHVVFETGLNPGTSNDGFHYTNWTVTNGVVTARSSEPWSDDV